MDAKTLLSHPHTLLNHLPLAPTSHLLKLPLRNISSVLLCLLIFGVNCSPQSEICTLPCWDSLSWFQKITPLCRCSSSLVLHGHICCGILIIITFVCQNFASRHIFLSFNELLRKYVSTFESEHTFAETTGIFEDMYLRNVATRDFTRILSDTELLLFSLLLLQVNVTCKVIMCRKSFSAKRFTEQN